MKVPPDADKKADGQSKEGHRCMIQLTRLNNQTFVVNSDLIKFVERSPDTVITLVTGEKIVVRDSVEQVLERIVEFRRSIAPQVREPGAAHGGNEKG
jgi:flagellar protein FlbD